MKRLSLALWAVAGCATVAKPAAQTAAPAAPSAIAHIEDRLVPAVLVQGEPRGVPLLTRMQQLRIAGVSVAVFRNNQIESAKAYGTADASTNAPATADTLFQAGSISKPVAALAAMMAVAQGYLSLDAPINDSLSSWKLPDNELTHKVPVTLRRLLSHTAGTTVHGFGGYPAGTPLPTLAQILDGTPPANSPAIRVDLLPGTKFRYSGGGFTIMQQALIDKLGRPFAAILHDSVLAPLHMSASSYDQPLPAARVALAAAGHDGEGHVVEGKRNVYPELAAAGLWTTPSDLARFFIEMQLARAGQSTVISRDLATQMTTKVAEAGPGMDIGLGLFLMHDGHTFGHNGADVGFQCYAVASLDHGYGVVIMANSDNGHRIFPEIVRTVAAEYGWEKRPETIVRAVLSPARLAQLPGRFAIGTLGPFTIAVHDARVELRRPFTAAVELVPIDDDVLVDVEDGARLTFDDGARTVTIAHAEGPTRQATRIDDDVHIPILELEAGHYEVALAGYLELQRDKPQSPALHEDFLNDLGLQQMFDKEYDKAIALLRINVALYPDSMNSYDSLAEAYMRAGDKAKAIEAYEAGLTAMARDHKTPPAYKEQLKKSAEKQLAILRGQTATP